MLGVTLIVLLAWGSVLAAESPLCQLRSMHVISDIRFRFARTQVTARFVNPSPATRGKEAVFHVALPDSAFVTDFKYSSSKFGQTFERLIQERISAYNTYARRYYRTSSEAKLVGSKNPNGTNHVKFIINLEPLDKITAVLTYEEILERKDGRYQHEIFIPHDQPMDSLIVDVAVHESRDLTNIQSYLKVENGSASDTYTEELDVHRPTSKSAMIRFQASADQLTQFQNGSSDKISVTYDLERGVDGGDVFVSNGYFVQFFAPEVTAVVRKDVLFMVDTSTSMVRNKLDQVKDAMKVMLNDLGPEDRFNVMSFGSHVDFWRNDMATKNREYIDNALVYLNSLEAFGWTNLMEPLSRGLAYMTNVSGSGKGMVIFLTDGRAVSGETNQRVISKNVRQINSKELPLYTLAFGKDADWNLTRKLAIQNSGIAKKIREGENAAKQIENFYESVSTSVFHKIHFKFGGNVKTTIQTYFNDFKLGSELVVAGEIDSNFDNSSVVVAVGASGVTSFVPKVVDLEEFKKAGIEVENVVKRMWIHLRFKDYFQRMAKENDPDMYDRIGQAAMKLSYRYRFLTPLSALLYITRNRYTYAHVEYRENTDNIYYLGEKAMLRYYQATRGSRGGAYGDPHFMVYMAGLQYPICFDVTGRDNEIYQLFRDPVTDLTVNTRMRNGRRKNKQGKSKLYFMTEFKINLGDLQLQITCHNVTLGGKTYPWTQDVNGTLEGTNFYLKVLTKKISRLSVIFESKLEIDVTSHVHRNPAHPGDDFLNIELGNQHVLSKKTDGLLGQFLHKKMRLKDIQFRNGRLVADLESRSGINRQHGRARIIHRKDPIWNTTTSCWLIKRMGARLLDGPAEYYVIQDMDQTNLIL